MLYVPVVYQSVAALLATGSVAFLLTVWTLITAHRRSRRGLLFAAQNGWGSNANVVGGAHIDIGHRVSFVCLLETLITLFNV